MKKSFVIRKSIKAHFQMMMAIQCQCPLAEANGKE
jgi:hypothetical protein